MKTKRLARLALLTALSLIIFMVELQFDIIPIPGVKIGLANIVTVYVIYRYSTGEAVMTSAVRVLLGTLLGGNVSALIYSIAGASLCIAGMLLVKKIIPLRFVWFSSIIGAILHNTGQITAAVGVMRSYSVMAYYPFLIVAGCIAGAFTGLCAQLLLKRTLPYEK